MKKLSVTAKTTLAATLLVALFLGTGGVVVSHLIQVMTRTSAETTLRSEVSSISSTIETIDEANISDPLDPLPPGQLAIIRNPLKIIVLNSFAKLAPIDITQIESAPLGHLSQFSSAGRDYWVLKSRIIGPGGTWQIVVSQSNQIGELFTHQTIILLVVLAFLLLIFSLIGSWLLSRFVIRPVSNMRKTAEGMILSNSREPLPVSAAGDEISKLAITLNELLHLLHQSVDKQTQLVADVSHELRSPLTILQMRLELALGQTKDPALLSEIHLMLASTGKLSSMIDQILFLAREPIVAEKQIAMQEEIESSTIYLVDNLRILSAKKAIDIEFEISMNASVQITKDGYERVLTNLVMNALANTQESGKVEVKLTQTETHLYLTICDSGVGFDPIFLPKAMNRFSRADESRNTETGGYGLGLALVKVILDSCNGRIELENRTDGPGAQVRVCLKNAS